MLSDVSGLGWRAGSLDTILKGNHLRIIPSKFGPSWLHSFREDFETFFPTGPMLKLSADLQSWLAGGVIRCNSQRGPLKTIPSKFGPYLLSSFREIFLKHFPIWSYVKTMSADLAVLVGGWSHWI